MSRPHIPDELLRAVGQMPTDDARLIGLICRRAVALGAEHDIDVYHFSIFLDLALAHLKTPLDLNLLLGADDGNFAHDVFGIARHVDRESGRLRDCFLPRTARLQHERTN
jgi:hypothetical protein